MARWREDPTESEWLGEAEIPADPVCAWDTEKNTMSVFIADSGIRTVEQLAAAIAATRASLQDFEYVMFESDDLKCAGLQLAEAEGKTADVASNRLHRNLVNISAQKLVALTARIRQRGVAQACDRVPRKVVATHIVRGLQEGRLDRAKIADKTFESAQKHAKIQ